MNNKRGFTLLEVLLALIILVSAVTIFSQLQLKSIDRILLGSEKLDRIFILKKHVYTAFFSPPKKLKPIKTKVQDPAMQVVTEFVDIKRKSELEQFADDLRLIKTDGEWTSGEFKESLSFLGIIKKPQDDKDKK